MHRHTHPHALMHTHTNAHAHMDACLCTHAHVHTLVHTCFQERTRAPTCTHVHAHSRTCTLVHVYAMLMHSRTCAHTFVHVDTSFQEYPRAHELPGIPLCTHMHSCTHLCTQVHTHSCTHAHVHLGSEARSSGHRLLSRSHGSAWEPQGHGAGGRTCLSQYAFISLLNGVCLLILNWTTEPSCPATLRLMWSFSVFTPSCKHTRDLFSAPAPARPLCSWAVGGTCWVGGFRSNLSLSGSPEPLAQLLRLYTGHSQRLHKSTEFTGYDLKEQNLLNDAGKNPQPIFAVGGLFQHPSVRTLPRTATTNETNTAHDMSLRAAAVLGGQGHPTGRTPLRHPAGTGPSHYSGTIWEDKSPCSF